MRHVVDVLLGADHAGGTALAHGGLKRPHVLHPVSVVVLETVLSDYPDPLELERPAETLRASYGREDERGVGGAVRYTSPASVPQPPFVKGDAREEEPLLRHVARQLGHEPGEALRRHLLGLGDHHGRRPGQHFGGLPQYPGRDQPSVAEGRAGVHQDDIYVSPHAPVLEGVVSYDELNLPLRQDVHVPQTILRHGHRHSGKPRGQQQRFVSDEVA